MADAAGPQPRVLVYDRIDANKRRTRLLLVLFSLAFLPAAAYLAIYLVFFVAVLLGVLFGVLTFGGAFAGDNLTVWAVVIPALAAVIVMLVPVAQFWYASELVLRLSHARPLREGEQPQLRRSVENLCIGAGLPLPRLCVIDSVAANAFSTGMSPQDSTLVVTTGLIALLGPLEMEAVLAHELSQIGNYDTRLGTVLAAGVAFLRLPFTVVINVFRFLFRLHWAVGGFFLLYLGLPALAGIPLALAAAITLIGEEPGQAAVMLVAVSLPLYSLVVAPFIAEAVRAFIFRERQFLADADAVLLARTAGPLALALTKMEPAAGVGLDIARSTAHLWTVNPSQDGPWWERIWPDHQAPVSERISLLERMSAGVPEAHLERARAEGQAFARQAPSPVGDVVPVRAAADRPRLQQRASVACRLSAEAPVYKAPDSGSPLTARLPAGSLITVHGEEGPFLHIITPLDTFGYILASTPMVPAETQARAVASPDEHGQTRILTHILLAPLAVWFVLALHMLRGSVFCLNLFDGC